jgi:hypothetical protein
MRGVADELASCQLQSISERFLEDSQRLWAHSVQLDQLLARDGGHLPQRGEPASCKARIAGAAILGNSSNPVGIGRGYPREAPVLRRRRARVRLFEVSLP